MKDFKDKVVVVTGGATGIGKSIADKFGKEGAKVIIAARRENKLQNAVNDMKEKGVDAYYKVCDVSNLDDVKALADYAWEKFGQVDVLVNNAGIMGIPEMIMDSSRESFQRIFDINVFGILNGIWAFGNRLIEQGTSAMIINVNSEVGLCPPGPMGGHYVSSKFAARGIAETLRLEVPDFIQVSCVFPGMVQSELGGSEEMTQSGMSTGEFISIIWPQIVNGEFYIISHPWGKDYVAETADEIINEFNRYAPHFEGDEIYNSRQLAKQMIQ